MREKIEELRDRWSEFKNDPNNKGKLIAIFTAIGAVVAVLVVILAFNLRDMSRNAQAVEAGGLIEGQSAATERNAAGGVIADIDWDTVIGYDRDGNPIYGTFGMVPTVGGYDMCGAPIFKEDMVVTGMAEDGLPIYGNYSAIEQARIRGLNDPDSDIDWNTIVAYDADGNPIFGSKSGDPNIIGYDMLGNPIYKGSVTVIGRTDSGLPIYNYSTIKTAKVAGKRAQNSLSKSNSGVDALAEALANKSTSGLTAAQIKALINGYLEDGVITDDEIAELASKLGLTVEQVRELLKKYNVGQDSTGTKNGVGGTANINLGNYTPSNSSSNKTGTTVDNPNAMERLIKLLSEKTGLPEDKIRSILSKYMSDGELTADELSKLAKELGISEDELKRLIQENGAGKTTVKNGSNGSSGSAGASGKNGSDGVSGSSGSNGVNGGRGISGSNGSSGSAGASGKNGSDGVSGSSGSNGASGKNGSTGASGSSGSTGASGSSGSDGASGSSGSTGLRGATGAAGKDGKDGKDANSIMYTVTFNSNGGSSVGSQKVVANGTAVKPGDPVKDGYTFDGWYKGSSAYDFGTPVTSDLSLTAKWSEKAYTITYNNIAGAGNIPSLTSYTVETDTYTLPEPTLFGYVFQGWTGTDLTSITKEVTIPKGSHGDRSYTANWTVAKPTIHFDWNFNDNMKELEADYVGTPDQFALPQTADLTVTYGKTYNEAVNLSDNLEEWPEIRYGVEVYGYYFKGWYIIGHDEEGNEKPMLVKEYSTVTATEDTTLYAGWEKSPYSVYRVDYYLPTLESCITYRETGNTSDLKYDVISEPFTDKSKTTVSPLPIEYKGFTSPEIKSARIEEDGSTVIPYYYTRNEYNLTVRQPEHSKAVTGSGFYYFGEKVTATCTPADGYKISGWESTPKSLLDGQNNTSTECTVNMPDGDVYLLPSIEAKPYTIIYNAQNGTGNTTSSVVLYDDGSGSPSTLITSSFTKPANKHFVGWSTTSNGTATLGSGNLNNVYRDDTSKTDAQANSDANGAVRVTKQWLLDAQKVNGTDDNINLYAVWAPDAYTLTIKHDGTKDPFNGSKITNVKSTSVTFGGTKYKNSNTITNSASARVDVGASLSLSETANTWTATGYYYDSGNSTNATENGTYNSEPAIGSRSGRHKRSTTYYVKGWTSSNTNLIANISPGNKTGTYTITKAMPAGAVTLTANGAYASSISGKQGFLYMTQGSATFRATDSHVSSPDTKLVANHTGSSYTTMNNGTWYNENTTITLKAGAAAAQSTANNYYATSAPNSTGSNGTWGVPSTPAANSYRWGRTLTPVIGAWSLSGASVSSVANGGTFKMPAKRVVATSSASCSAAIASGSIQQYKPIGGGATTTSGTANFGKDDDFANRIDQKSLGSKRHVTSCSLEIQAGEEEWNDSGDYHSRGSDVRATIYVVKDDGSAVSIGSLSCINPYTHQQKTFTCDVYDASYVRIVYSQDSPCGGHSTKSIPYVKYSAYHVAGYGWG